MTKQTWLLAVVVSLSSGCTTSIRSSSATHLAAKDSEVFLQGGVDDAARRVAELLSKRGLNMTSKQALKDGSLVYTFKGKRTDLTTVTGGDAFVFGSTNSVGSAVFARFAPKEDGVTQVLFHGKPSMDGRIVCSTDAPTWVPACGDDVYAGSMWQGRDQMTGKDEAEIIRGVMLEMELGQPDGPGAMVARKAEAAAEAAKPACVASEHPAWATSSAVEKKRLLEQCRTPASQVVDTR
ncbi:hypothetical protein LZ198_03795 [Myxococcus sp. K15C18031901]|uniref:hypothetical protein n=1 Tax=Myxococcus dinghuensis TaxID=2906761 RepID=UPI0020A7C934|nr:hypothetical protein [Myxococcus dinghuensis]MCP3097996.1 hypothetical protein [Myxococcus dinghuensis]